MRCASVLQARQVDHNHPNSELSADNRCSHNVDTVEPVG
jgi:hypothetical protein